MEKVNHASEETIRNFANTVREQVKDGFICGAWIDPDNIDHLIFAAYWLGEKMASERQLQVLAHYG